MALRINISEDAPYFRLEGLYREFAAECREKRPLPSPETFDALEGSQYKVIKELISERRKTFINGGENGGGWCVFNSSLIGLAAFTQATEGRSDNTILLTIQEMKEADQKVNRLLRQREFDNDIFTSFPLYFDSLNRYKKDFKKDYAYFGGKLLCLRDSYVVGPLCGRGSNSIWHWDGVELKKVDDGTMWIS